MYKCCLSLAVYSTSEAKFVSQHVEFVSHEECEYSKVRKGKKNFKHHRLLLASHTIPKPYYNCVLCMERPFGNRDGYKSLFRNEFISGDAVTKQTQHETIQLWFFPNGFTFNFPMMMTHDEWTNTIYYNIHVFALYFCVLYLTNTHTQRHSAHSAWHTKVGGAALFTRFHFV